MRIEVGSVYAASLVPRPGDKRIAACDPVQVVMTTLYTRYTIGLGVANDLGFESSTHGACDVRRHYPGRRLVMPPLGLGSLPLN